MFRNYLSISINACKKVLRLIFLIVNPVADFRPTDRVTLTTALKIAVFNGEDNPMRCSVINTHTACFILAVESFLWIVRELRMVSKQATK